MKSSSHELIFRNATSGYFKQVWDEINSDPFNLVSSMDGFVKVKEEDFIYINERTFLKIYLSDQCGLVMGKEFILPTYTGWIMPKNWPYAHAFNAKIVILRESGILDMIFHKNTLPSVSCKKPSGAVQLGMSSLRGIFALLTIGCVSGLLV